MIYYLDDFKINPKIVSGTGTARLPYEFPIEGLQQQSFRIGQFVCDFNLKKNSCSFTDAEEPREFSLANGWTVSATGFSIDQDILTAREADVKVGDSGGKKVSNLKISLINGTIDFNDKELNDMMK
jgi:hypothetical protein